MSVNMSAPLKALRRQPKQRRGQERVERILDAAAETFDQVGYDAATMQAIAARARTAIGSLYQFFPDKQAIFHALELRHIERVHAYWQSLDRPEVIHLPFEAFIHTLGTESRKLFAHPISRVVFVQFFTAPAVFQSIDERFTQEAISFVAHLLQQRNPTLAPSQSQLLAEVCVHAVNTLFVVALRSPEPHQQQLFGQIEALMSAYLRPYVGDEVLVSEPEARSAASSQLQSTLSPRQRLALEFAQNHGGLTIQDFATLCPQVSRRTLQRELRVMVEKGLLLPTGKTNQLCYQLYPGIL